MDTQVYYIPLCPFEVTLLLQAREFSAIDVLPQNQTDQSLFTAWIWSQRVISEFTSQLTEETLADDHDGDVELGYRDCLRQLSSQGSLSQSTFRAKALEHMNPQYPEVLRHSSIESIQFCPADEDSEAWQIIAALSRLGALHKMKEYFSASPGFNIYRTVYNHRDNMTLPLNADEMTELLIAVTEHWEIKLADSFRVANSHHETLGLKRWRFCIRSKSRAPHVWPANEPQTNRDGEYTDKYIGFMLKRADAESWIEGIIENITNLPNEELKSVSIEDLEAAGINLAVPFQDATEATVLQYVLWKPRWPTPLGAHLLHTEDEVFQYCVVNDWCFPDHLHEEEVIFAAHPLSSTKFIPNLQHFWQSWNDCCVTWNLHERQLYLLETIPGMRYRSRQQNQDKEVALRYFRNLVEAHARGHLHDTTMQDLLGAEHYNNLFSHSLQYIPENQITIHENPFIGEGKNGRVFRATWKRPPAVLATSRRGEDVEVALKAVKTAGVSRKFIQEMELTYASLGGSGVGCIDLFGISTIPTTKLTTQNPEASIGQANPNRSIVLVTSLANQGSIRDYLCHKFPQTTFIESWNLTIDILSSIANGLNTLHRHNVIHRDLHLNNILINRKYFPTETRDRSYEDSALIADVGEGQHISSLLTPQILNASVLERDFHAPETIQHRQWSAASDIWAFGVVVCKVLDLRSSLCPEKVPEHVLQSMAANIDDENTDTRTTNATATATATTVITDTTATIVPAAVSKLLQACLSASPVQRWNARECVDVLEDLSMEFFGEKLEPDPDRRVKWVGGCDWWATFDEAHVVRTSRTKEDVWENRGGDGDGTGTSTGWTLAVDAS